jgi:hypothetical protein
VKRSELKKDGCRVTDYKRRHEERIVDRLEKLKREFSELADMFPKMGHFQLMWPGPALPPHIMSAVFEKARREHNTCFASRAHASAYQPGCKVQYWLIRAPSKNWRTDVAARQLKYHSRRGVNEVKRLPDLLMLKVLSVDSDLLMRADSVESWLFLVRRYQKPTLLSVMTGLIPRKWEDKLTQFRATMIPDVFHASVVFLDELLKDLRQEGYGIPKLRLGEKCEGNGQPKTGPAAKPKAGGKVESVQEATGLTDTESNIIEALSTNVMTGEELAVRAGYPYNSNFKSTLSSLRKRGILGNKAPGYFVEPEYHFLLSKSD